MPLISPVMVVLGHPRPDSFNHALAASVRGVLSEAGARCHYHDLYAEGFDPLLTGSESVTTGDLAAAGSATDPLLTEHRRQLGTARALVVVHPNWWGKPPAIMSGWLDRVLAPGVAYRLADPSAPLQPLLDVRRLLVINTTDTAPDRERNDIGDPLDLIWRRAVAPVLGTPEIERMVLPLVTGSRHDQRVRWLSGVTRAAAWVAGAAR